MLSHQQVELVRERLSSRLKIELKKIVGLDRKAWWPISRQIYADVARHGKPDRVDTFNGNYGLNRGLASACVLLACIAATQQSWGSFALLVVLSLVYGYRAYRFGVHYGRELYIQFLTIADTEKAPTKKKVAADER